MCNVIKSLVVQTTAIIQVEFSDGRVVETKFKDGFGCYLINVFRVSVCYSSLPYNNHLNQHCTEVENRLLLVLKSKSSK